MNEEREMAIRRLVGRLQETQFDIEPFLALHTEDTVIVNFGGRRAFGRGDLRRAMESALASPLGEVTTTAEVDDIRFVRADIPIVSCTKHVFDERETSESSATKGTSRTSPSRRAVAGGSPSLRQHPSPVRDGDLVPHPRPGTRRSGPGVAPRLDQRSRSLTLPPLRGSAANSGRRTAGWSRAIARLSAVIGATLPPAPIPGSVAQASPPAPHGSYLSSWPAPARQAEPVPAGRSRPGWAGRPRRPGRRGRRAPSRDSASPDRSGRRRHSPW